MASEIGKVGVVGIGLTGSSVAQAPRLLGQLGISDSACQLPRNPVLTAKTH